MKDGEIVQIGTPEELLLNPATDYVEDFTKGISRSKVLSVKSVMEPSASHESVDTSISVSEHAKINDIASVVLDYGGNVMVVNDNNQTIGILAHKVVIDVLVTRDQ